MLRQPRSERQAAGDQHIFGTFLGFNCGILSNSAVTVRKGVGYQFGFRDLAIHAATEPSDRALLLELIKSVHVPA